MNDYVFVRLSRIRTAASDLLHEVKIDAELYISKGINNVRMVCQMRDQEVESLLSHCFPLIFAHA